MEQQAAYRRLSTAANALQSDSSNRHTTTANPKVSGTIPASPLVIGRRCSRSHGRRLTADSSTWRRPYKRSASEGDPMKRTVVLLLVCLAAACTSGGGDEKAVPATTMQGPPTPGAVPPG